MTEEQVIELVREWWAYRGFQVTPIDKIHNRIKYHVTVNDVSIIIYDECQHHKNATCEGESIQYIHQNTNQNYKQLPSFYFEE